MCYVYERRQTQRRLRIGWAIADMAMPAYLYVKHILNILSLILLGLSELTPIIAYPPLILGS